MLYEYLLTCVVLLSGLGFWVIFVPFWIYSKKMLDRHLRSPEYKAKGERSFSSVGMFGRIVLTVFVFEALAALVYKHPHAQADTLALLMLYMLFIVLQLYSFQCTFKSKNPVYLGRLRKILLLNPVLALAYCLLFTLVAQNNSGAALTVPELMHGAQGLPQFIADFIWPVGEAIWSVMWILSTHRWIGSRQQYREKSVQEPVHEPVQNPAQKYAQKPFKKIQKTASGLRLEDIASGNVFTEDVEESLRRYRVK